MFCGLCVFGCTWHNIPASALSLAGMVYFSARAMECLSAWLSVKWREIFCTEELHSMRGADLRAA